MITSLNPVQKPESFKLSYNFTSREIAILAKFFRDHQDKLPEQDGANFAGTCNGYAAGSCGTGKTATSQNITFTDGAVCNGHVSGSCKGIFDSGSRCVANVAGACAGTYQNGGCCEGGDNCPANAPRC